MKFTQREIETLLKENIATDPRWAKWTLLMLYNSQTEGEKLTGENKEDNGKGFTRNDARFLTSVAEHYIGHGWLSPNQLGALHRALPRYWRQVVDALGEDRLPGIVAGTFVPELKSPTPPVDSVQVHKVVRRGLEDAFPRQQIIEGWSPPWLKGSSFDYFVNGVQLAVDVTATPQRPITTTTYHQDAARKNAFAGHRGFKLAFVRADKPDPAEQLKSFIRLKFGGYPPPQAVPKPIQPPAEDTLFDENGELRVTILPDQRGEALP